MKRVNEFRLRPTKEQEHALLSLCEMSAVLWNKLTYRRRQAFFQGRFDWKDAVDELYHDFKRLLGSATTQQVIRKNDEAWRSFFALLKLEKQGKFPSHVRRISPPGYWKNRRTGKRKLMTVIRNDCYRIIEEEKGRGNKKNKKKWLVLPKGLKISVTGELKWRGGKQGRLELFYDALTGRWHARQSVTVNHQQHQPRVTASRKGKAFVDLGIINLMTRGLKAKDKPLHSPASPCLQIGGTGLKRSRGTSHWSRRLME